jgi:pyroglutamyl-peptidase
VLTGFEPFSNFKKNSSEQLVNFFHENKIPGYIIQTEILEEKLMDILSNTNADYMILTGQSSEPVISLEQVALNYLHTRIPDNKGINYKNLPIKPDGNEAYFTQLSWSEILTELRLSGIPCSLSMSAGTYACNQAYYLSQYYIDKQNLKTKCGFIHIPPLPEEIARLKLNVPSMGNSLTIKALQIIVNEFK